MSTTFGFPVIGRTLHRMSSLDHGAVVVVHAFGPHKYTQLMPTVTFAPANELVMLCISAVTTDDEMRGKKYCTDDSTVDTTSFSHLNPAALESVAVVARLHGGVVTLTLFVWSCAGVECTDPIKCQIKIKIKNITRQD